MTDLHVEALSKVLGSKQVLRDLDLAVESGRLVAILGVSGSGKTTLLRTLCGFERPDAGTIRLGDTIVADRSVHFPPERRQIGYVAQEGALFPHLSVAENIVFGLPRRERRKQNRVDELLELVGLPFAYASRPPQHLSGGEQQRVALARALAPGPSLVLLDEPFSSLDASLRIETREAVARAIAAAGATAVLVTHDQAEALSMGHEVGVLRDGSLVQMASPEILYRRPVDAALARFIGESVLLAGIAQGGRAACVLGELTLADSAADGAVDIMIRPEQIRLCPGGEGRGQDARIIAATYYGHEALVRLFLSGTAPPVELCAYVSGHLCPQPGDLVKVHVEGEAVAFPRLAPLDTRPAAARDGAPLPMQTSQRLIFTSS